MADSTKILEDVKNGKCTIVEAQELLSQLKLKQMKTVTYKVSPKGAISFYGVRRLPITIYKEEIDQLLPIMKSDEFTQFLINNKDKLSTKEKSKDS